MRAGAAARQAGFTLFEILVVVAIIAIATGAVLLQVRLPPAGDPQTVRQSVARLMQSGLDEAIFNGRELALSFSRADIAVLERDDADGTWAPVSKPEVLATPISLAHVVPRVVMEGRQISLPPTNSGTKPDAFILSSGETTPFRLLIGSPDKGGPVVELDVDAYGRVTLPAAPGS